MTTLPYFTFNGETSADHKLFIVNKNVYNGAERDISFQAIPGRNGELIIDNKRYKNVAIEYQCGILVADNAALLEATEGIKQWLAASPNYYRLSDTYDTSAFRMASVKGGFSFDTELEGYGTCTITFNCKPFRYLTSGETVQTFEEADDIVNPGLESTPYIKLYGSGDMTLTIGSKTYQFRNVDDYIEIDSAAMQCYKGTANRNNKMYTEDFPVIAGGTQTVSFTGATKVDIVPRWCTL